MEKIFKRKICVVTGTRAEYGLLKPLMEEIKKSNNLSLEVLVMGMHFSPTFGLTVKEIEQDGFRDYSGVKMTANKDTNAAMAESIGRGIIKTARIFEKNRPDIVIVLGDRVESLAAAISAAYMNIIVAHIHGGDSARAGLDEYARHAITKFSHIHFPATRKSAERIIKMGEDKRRVFVVGAPGLDGIINEKLISKREITRKYKLDLSKPFLLILQHPVTTEVEDAELQIKETMEAIKELNLQTILIYPNADAGGRRIIKVILQYRKYPFIKIYKNIPRRDYLSLMKAASAMVGNSSSGIIEAPSFHLPVVNIGARQDGRERAENTIDVGYNRKEIKKAIKLIYNKEFKEKLKKIKNPYGDGRASKRIVGILNKIAINKRLLQKKLTY